MDKGSTQGRVFLVPLITVYGKINLRNVDLAVRRNTSYATNICCKQSRIASTGIATWRPIPAAHPHPILLLRHLIHHTRMIQVLRPVQVPV